MCKNNRSYVCISSLIKYASNNKIYIKYFKRLKEIKYKDNFDDNIHFNYLLDNSSQYRIFLLRMLIRTNYTGFCSYG